MKNFINDVKNHKDLLDSTNSLSWFFMDACWMLKHEELAILFAPVVLGSGIILVSIDERRPQLCINLGIVSWILMNICWMMAEIVPNLIPHWLLLFFLFSGLVSILFALIISNNIKETFSHFRRFRLKTFIK